MMELVLLVGIPVAIVVGLVGWKLGFDRGDARQTQVPGRRREDARDWQRRFGTELLLTEHFFPPTQNEILETLYLLDHLTPRWETGDAAAVERAFLNELALNFPTLRKPDSAFSSALPDRPDATEIAGRREAFRAQRAQFNALDQIISSAVPANEAAAAGAPFGRTETVSVSGAKNLWPIFLGSAAVLVAAVLGGLRFFPAGTTPKVIAQAIAVSPSAVPAAPAAEASPEPTPAVIEAVVEAVPSPSPAPTAQVGDTKPEVAPRATPSLAAQTLDRQVAASKQRAVNKYPALAVEGSEINLRFVFRYKNLVQENSPRLLDPNWPEQLVEECAAAAGVTARRDGFTRVLGTPR